MAASVETYDQIAKLFEYPSGDYRETLDKSCAQLASVCPEAEATLRSFAEQVADFDESALEELFTRTFDLNPVCCPEVGWQLFGERYDRGSFLLWMRGQLRDFGLSESGELPDHLLHVLAVLGRMDSGNAGRFATDAVSPALARMIPSLEEKKNPYADVLKSVQQLLTAEYGPARQSPDGTPWALQDAIGLTHGSKE
jgi:nitrate reductase delta subunit